MKFECAHDKLVKVSELMLIQNPKNANNHSKEQIDRLAKIIDFAGQRSPIVVSNRSGFIVKGHGRLMAIHKLGWSEAAVDYQDYVTEAAEYQDMVADNEIARWAEFNEAKFIEDVATMDIGDIELFGLKEIPDLLHEKKEELTDADEVPEVAQNIHGVVLGQIYKLGDHRLMCGDSTDLATVEKLMNGEKADMVFTDPPYGIDIVKGSIGGSRSFGSVGGGKIVKANLYSPIIGDDTVHTAVDSYNLCASLKIETLIFWGGNYYASSLPNSSCWLVWDKQNTGNFADCELAWTNQKTAVRQFKHMWNGMIKASEHGSKRVHPTQKPVALAEWAFQEYNNPKSVLDLFGGSGSTLIACEKTNRKCFMMELDPHYCSVIIERWKNFTGKKAELLNG